MVPNDHTTPTVTTIRHTVTTAMLRKKRNNSSAVTTNAAPTKYPSSPFTLLAMEIRMNGRPLK